MAMAVFYVALMAAIVAADNGVQIRASVWFFLIGLIIFNWFLMIINAIVKALKK